MGYKSKMEFRSSLIVVVLLGLTQMTFSQDVKLNAGTFEMKQPSASEPLTLLWGIADTTAYVGRLFTYTLPSDAFQGNIIHYDITEAGKPTLPAWLTFNPLKTELKGIPGPEDKGQIYLEVKVTGDDNSQASDVFSIEVLDDTNGQTSAIKPGNSAKVVRCRRDEPQTIVTVVVDCDLHLMHPDEKMNLLDNMVNHLNLVPEVMKMMPVGNKPMFDSGALVIGPGNRNEPKTSGGLLSWMVGCGKVGDDHMSVLEQVQTAAANGDMSSALGHDIIGWHVTNTRFQIKQRKRRAATATPTNTPPAPTKMVEVSSTQQVESSSSVPIMPSKSVVITTTQMPEKSTMTSSSSSMDIAPSESIKMTKTEMRTSTPALPAKTSMVMTSSTTEEIKPTTTQTTPSTTSPTPAPTPKSTPEPTPAKPVKCPPKSKTEKPEVKRPLGDIKLKAGQIKKLKLPEDTFFDCYSNSVSDLDIKLKNADGSMLPSGFWLELKARPSKPYTFVSNPLNTDAGVYGMKLSVMNSYGNTIDHEFKVIVQGSVDVGVQPNHELSMRIEADYDVFMSDLENRIELSNKVASIFGDRNSKSLTVTRLEPGSVVYAWTNNSVGTSGCPVEEIKSLVGKMFNEDGALTQEAKDAMHPYTINSAGAVPQGDCENNPNFPSRSMSKIPVQPTAGPTPAPTPKPTPTEKDSDDIGEPIATPTSKPTMKPKTTAETEQTTAAVAAAGAGSGGSDIWITTVVPAIVVVAVLIIALVIACCLYRKKRKGKMKLEEQKQFSPNKGVPVIFADEYDEKPNESTRPLIMEDEKPPMPPPEYQRASSETSGNSTNSTQPIEDKDIEEIELEDTSEISPLYSPPPPVTASSNNKPPHVPTSRGPPPYVPP